MSFSRLRPIVVYVIIAAALLALAIIASYQEDHPSGLMTPSTAYAAELNQSNEQFTIAEPSKNAVYTEVFSVEWQGGRTPQDKLLFIVVYVDNYESALSYPQVKITEYSVYSDVYPRDEETVTRVDRLNQLACHKRGRCDRLEIHVHSDNQVETRYIPSPKFPATYKCGGLVAVGSPENRFQTFEHTFIVAEFSDKATTDMLVMDGWSTCWGPQSDLTKRDDYIYDLYQRRCREILRCDVVNFYVGDDGVPQLLEVPGNLMPVTKPQPAFKP